MLYKRDSEEFAAACFPLLLVLLGIFTLAAQSQAQDKSPSGEPAKIVKTDYDPRTLAEARERVLAMPEASGRKLFISRCALCHDPLGHSAPMRQPLGPWLDAALVTARGETAVRNSILNGSATMPGYQHQFDKTKIDQIIAYIKTISAEARPKGLRAAERTGAPAPPD